MKIYIDGRDKIGWSIDMDRKNLIKSIKRLNFKITKFKSLSNLIHNIWWNQLKINKKQSFLSKNRKILVTASNFIDLENEKYDLYEKFIEINKIVDGWICPSTKQKKILENFGFKCFYQPFYIDIDIFKPNKRNRLEILKELNIPLEIFQNKFIISSFQRDSVGNNLSKPKRQKGPELLIDILKEMPKNKYILFLAGPRRHFVINECKKNNIPYYYFGTEMINDDIIENTIDINIMPKLYAITDIYLVTSSSEGGPKAVMESAMTKTFILSTDVGLASDFINSKNIFNDIGDYKKRLYELLNTDFDLTSDIEEQYNRAYNILNYDAMDSRLFKIYQEIFN